MLWNLEVAIRSTNGLPSVRPSTARTLMTAAISSCSVPVSAMNQMSNSATVKIDHLISPLQGGL